MSDSVAAIVDDYDSPWKEALERYFPEFMAFYFPAAHAGIDWSKGYLSRETELRQVVRDAELGKRFADVLMQVTLATGTPEWIYAHIEVQGQQRAQFSQRMFVYNYRLFDRFECPIASFAVLADDDEHWRPDHFSFDVLGCRHSLHFPVVKLLDYSSRLDDLLSAANPFALVTAAHLLTRQTRKDADARYEAKRKLVRLLYRRDWDKQRILDLFAILDWMMRLPDALEQKLWQDIETIEGENRMRYVTSVERLAAERGLKAGMQQGMQRGRLEGEVALLERQLIKRFGPLTAEIRQRLVDADTGQLECWAERVLDAPTLSAVFEQH